jgi:hypothetical protein
MEKYTNLMPRHMPCGAMRFEGTVENVKQIEDWLNNYLSCKCEVGYVPSYINGVLAPRMSKMTVCSTYPNAAIALYERDYVVISQSFGEVSKIEAVPYPVFWGTYRDMDANGHINFELPAYKDMSGYDERNILVRLLAEICRKQGINVGIKATTIEVWDNEWHNCVYIDLPTGQVSWHYHDKLKGLFRDLDTYRKEWDGHDSDTKYKRIKEYLDNLVENTAQEW